MGAFYDNATSVGQLKELAYMYFLRLCEWGGGVVDGGNKQIDVVLLVCKNPVPLSFRSWV